MAFLVDEQYLADIIKAIKSLLINGEDILIESFHISKQFPLAHPDHQHQPASLTAKNYPYNRTIVSFASSGSHGSGGEQ